MLAAVAAFTGAVEDPDFWWHLSAGRWMLEHGRLPSHDLFTYTVSDHAWTDHEYLTEVLMALLTGWGGLAAISIVFAVVTYVGFIFIYRTARVSRQPYVVAGVGLALAALAGAPIWGPRAQMITFTLSAVELYWISGYLAGRSRSINFLPLLVIVWANLHGGFVVAFLFLGIAIAAELVELALQREAVDREPHRRRLRTLGRVLLLSGIAVLATPHGTAVYLNPLETLTSPAQRRLIVEWFSPDFHVLALLPFMAMLLLVVIGFALRRPTAYQMLLTVTAIALSLESARHIAIFIAAVTPVLIETWGGAWQDFSEGRGWHVTSSPPSRLLQVTTAVALLVIAGAVSFRVTGELGRQAGHTRGDYPVAAANWLAQHPEVGTRMYNQYGWGGYLVNRFFPDGNRRVFIYGEASVMGDRFLQKYQDVQTLRSDWAEVLDEYRVDYVVYNRHEALTNVLEALPDKWDCNLYGTGDPVAEICVRRP